MIKNIIYYTIVFHILANLCQGISYNGEKGYQTLYVNLGQQNFENTSWDPLISKKILDWQTSPMILPGLQTS